MKYKVNMGSPALASVGGGFAALSASTVSIPAPYRWIIFGIWMILLASVVWWVAVVALRNRTLSFEERALVFPRRAVYPEEIQHIFIHERWSYFMIYFNRRRAPISVSFRKGDTDAMMSELRQWALANHVLCKTRQRKRA